MSAAATAGQPGHGTVLRAAEPSDLDGIMRIERDSFPSDAWSERAMAADLDSEHTRYLVIADTKGTVLGYGGILAPDRSGDADIQTIAVSALARGRGWGRLLLTELMALAAGRGARELFLEVRADNPVAQSLYRSLGFEQLAVRPGYYQPEGIDALVMRASLATRPHDTSAPHPDPSTGAA